MTSHNLTKPYLPHMAQVCVFAQIQSLMITQESSLLSHAQLPFLTGDLHKPSVSSGSKRNYFPLFLFLSTHDMTLFVIQKFLCKRVINVICLKVLMMRGICLWVWLWLWLMLSFLHFHKFPNIVFDDVVRVWRAAWHLVDLWQIWECHLMRMQEILCP